MIKEEKKIVCSVVLDLQLNISHNNGMGYLG